MISPANTYVGLTTSEPGSAPGEPAKYYPSGVRTYMRIVPRDSIQAASDALAMKQAGCTHIALANDKTPYGAGIATQIELIKKNYGINVVSNTGRQPDRAELPFLRVHDQGPGSGLLLLRRSDLHRRRPDHQGRALGDPERPSCSGLTACA